MRFYQMGTKRVIYLHNLCSMRGNFISAPTFGLSVSDTLARPAGRPTRQSYLGISDTPLICPLACYRP